MRATILAILFAFAAACVRADPIDNAITNLPDGWSDEPSGLIIVPQDTSPDDALQKVFQGKVFADVGTVTNFTVLKTRQVKIPVGHFEGARAVSYSAYLIKPSRGGNLVVLLRYLNVYPDAGAWASAVFAEEPSPGSVRQPPPLTPAVR